MSIRTLSRTRAAYLCSLAQVRESLVRMGAAAAVVSDDALRTILDGVRSAFEAEIGRPVLRGTFEEQLAGTGRARVYLTARPIVRGSLSIALDGEDVTAWTLDPYSGKVTRDRGVWPEDARPGEDGRDNISAVYTGGYVAPSLVLSWAPSLEVAAGQWLRHPTAPELLLECTTAGTMAEAAPEWPSEAGEELVSGSAELVAREAQELPEQIRDLAAYCAMVAYQAQSQPVGVVSIEAEGVKATFAQGTAPSPALPEFVCRALAGWRDLL